MPLELEKLENEIFEETNKLTNELNSKFEDYSYLGLSIEEANEYKEKIDKNLNRIAHLFGMSSRLYETNEVIKRNWHSTTLYKEKIDGLLAGRANDLQWQSVVDLLDKQQELLESINQNDNKKLEKLLYKKSAFDLRLEPVIGSGEQNESLLILAVQKNNLAAVKMLVESGAEIDYVVDNPVNNTDESSDVDSDVDDSTEVHSNDNESGESNNADDSSEISNAHDVNEVAVQGNIVTSNFAHITSDDIDDVGNTPFLEACKQGNIPIIEYLLDKGANHNYVSLELQETALTVVMKQQNYDLFTKLIKGEISNKKINFNYNRTNQANYNVIYLMQSAPLDTLKFVVSQVSDIDFNQISNYANDDENILMEFFTEEGIKLNDDFLNNEQSNFTPEQKEEYIKQMNEWYDKYEFLIEEAKFNINWQDKEGNTVLHKLTEPRRINPDFVEVFIHLGADQTLRNKEGKTPLELAKQNDNPVIKELLENEHGILIPKNNIINRDKTLQYNVWETKLRIWNERQIYLDFDTAQKKVQLENWKAQWLANNKQQMIKAMLSIKEQIKILNEKTQLMTLNEGSVATTSKQLTPPEEIIELKKQPEIVQQKWLQSNEAIANQCKEYQVKINKCKEEEQKKLYKQRQEIEAERIAHQKENKKIIEELKCDNEKKDQEIHKLNKEVKDLKVLLQRYRQLLEENKQEIPAKRIKLEDQIPKMQVKVQEKRKSEFNPEEQIETLQSQNKKSSIVQTHQSPLEPQPSTSYQQYEKSKQLEEQNKQLEKQLAEQEKEFHLDKASRDSDFEDFDEISENLVYENLDQNIPVKLRNTNLDLQSQSVAQEKNKSEIKEQEERERKRKKEEKRQNNAKRMKESLGQSC